MKVVNNTARQGPETTERKPALGPSFGLLTDSTLWLEKTAVYSNAQYSVKLIGSRLTVLSVVVPSDFSGLIRTVY